MTWTAERRAAQSARIRAHRPWDKSTGPRTAAGKAKSSRNAYKHGFRCGHTMKALRALLRLQRDYVRALHAAADAGKRLTPADRARLLGRPAMAVHRAWRKTQAERTIGRGAISSLFRCASLYNSGINRQEHIENAHRVPPDADQNLDPRRA
jgi:hypothetical protein